MLESEPTYLLGRTSLGVGDPPVPAEAPEQPPVSTDTAPGRQLQPRARGTSNPFAGRQRSQRFHAAGFFRRLAAGLIDLIILAPIAIGLGWVASTVTGVTLPPARHRGVDFWLDLILTLDPALCGFAILAAALFIAYSLFFQATLAQTPGMMVVKTRVIDIYGDPPGVGRAFLRTLCTLLSMASFGLGFLWIGFDGERRGLHDWLAGTHVVRTEYVS